MPDPETRPSVRTLLQTNCNCFVSVGNFFNFFIFGIGNRLSKTETKQSVLDWICWSRFVVNKEESDLVGSLE